MACSPGLGCPALSHTDVEYREWLSVPCSAGEPLNLNAAVSRTHFLSYCVCAHMPILYMWDFVYMSPPTGHRGYNNLPKKLFSSVLFAHEIIYRCWWSMCSQSDLKSICPISTVSFKDKGPWRVLYRFHWLPPAPEGQSHWSDDGVWREIYTFICKWHLLVSSK